MFESADSFLSPGLPGSSEPMGISRKLSIHLRPPGTTPRATTYQCVFFFGEMRKVGWFRAQHQIKQMNPGANSSAQQGTRRHDRKKPKAFQTQQRDNGKTYRVGLQTLGLKGSHVDAFLGKLAVDFLLYNVTEGRERSARGRQGGDQARTTGVQERQLVAVVA